MLSLDATVVLLTPVVVATAARMRTPSLPHAYAAGHLANSASLLLPVSNLTNLLAFAATGLSFLHFTGLMLAPWLVAVAVEFAVLRWLFRAELAKPAGEPVTTVPPLPVVAVVVVGLVVVGFGVASLVGVSPVWPAVRRRRWCSPSGSWSAGTTRVADLVRAADLPFALFVLALAVVVLAVLHNGVETFLHTVLPDGDALLRPADRRRGLRAAGQPAEQPAGDPRAAAGARRRRRRAGARHADRRQRRPEPDLRRLAGQPALAAGARAGRRRRRRSTPPSAWPPCRSRWLHGDRRCSGPALQI